MDRPKLQLVKTSTDIFLEKITLLILVFLWVFVIVSYKKLPAQIPSHYDWQGKPDHYDDKTILFLLPAIITVLVLLLRFLNRFPNKFNYLSTITAENAAQQYAISSQMIRMISLVIVIAFSYITMKTVHDSKQPYSKLDWWFIPFLIIGLLGTTIYYVAKGMKLAKKTTS